ncbi:MAG: adenylate/guanylate cyclase domain-containing protein [Thiotrichaceae bacterium]
MGLTNNLSIRSKLVLLLLLTSIFSIMIIAWQGYRSANDALSEATYNQLNTLRAAKTQQVASYFKNIENQVLGFAENRVVIEALNEFRTAFHLANRESLSEGETIELENYYRKEFIPRLNERIGGKPEVNHFLPKTGAAAYLQYHYIAVNANKVGEKATLIKAKKDEGYFAQVHERYHESLYGLIKQFGYYDLFLIDHETGNIIYTVHKETDFATNLNKGPYASSNFARLIERIRENKKRGDVKFQDFDIYFPSYGAPAAFVAITVYDGLDVAGILAVQVPSKELNNAMTSNHDWSNNGMGETGEVYLVGRNHLMRTDSRFLKQHRERYLKQLKKIGTPPETIKLIDKHDTTILFQTVNAKSVDLALAGKTGTQEVIDYRGVPVMSAFAPLRTHGMDWIILAEMDMAEINQPIDKFRRNVMVAATVLGVIITLLALYAAHYFTRPIHTLVAALRRVGDGETNVQVNVRRNDEIGELSTSFNNMTSGIQKQQQLIAEKEQENELLLQNILPDPIARRMRAGEDPIVDEIPNVSVIFATLTGLVANQHDSPEKAITKLNRLIGEFDEITEKFGIDKIKTIGDDYMAACGLVTTRLDHGKRAVNFAKELVKITRRLSHEFEQPLTLSVGIHSGSLLAGVVGQTRFVYDIWGETVDIANEVRSKAQANTILITEQTFNTLHDKGQFTSHEELISDNGTNIPTWLQRVED